MKKWTLLGLCLMLALSMAACGSSNTETTAAETVDETEDAEGLDGEEEDEDGEEEDLGYEPIEVADYNPDDYVKLSEYKGLPVDLQKAEVLDEDVDYEIETVMEEYAEEKDKEEPSEEEDYVVADYTVSVDGKEIPDAAEENKDFYIGFAEFGYEVDEALTGVKVGDKVTAQTELDDMFGEEYEGKTGTFNLTVKRVYTYETPELTDEFAKEKLGAESADAYRESVKESLLQSAQASARSDAGEMLLSQIADESEITGHPDDLYASVEQELTNSYTYYAEMFGAELSDMISDEDLKEAVEDEVNMQMVMKAIIKAEKLELTDEEYQKFLEGAYEDYGYESAEELEADYSREELEVEALRSKVHEFLLANAQVTELTPEEYSAKYDTEEEYEDDEAEDYAEDDDLELEDDGEEIEDAELEVEDDGEEIEDAELEVEDEEE